MNQHHFNHVFNSFNLNKQNISPMIQQILDLIDVQRLFVHRDNRLGWCLSLTLRTSRFIFIKELFSKQHAEDILHLVKSTEVLFI